MEACLCEFQYLESDFDLGNGRRYCTWEGVDCTARLVHLLTPPYEDPLRLHCCLTVNCTSLGQSATSNWTIRFTFLLFEKVIYTHKHTHKLFAREVEKGDRSDAYTKRVTASCSGFRRKYIECTHRLCACCSLQLLLGTSQKTRTSQSMLWDLHLSKGRDRREREGRERENILIRRLL